MTFEVSSLIPALPEIFLAVAGMVFLLLGVFRKEDSTQIISWLGVAAMAVTGYLILRGPASAVTFNDLFIVNGFTSFAKILVLIGGALTIISPVRDGRGTTVRLALPIAEAA